MANGGGERVVPASVIPLATARVIVAPFQLYLDGADALRLEGWSSAPNTTLQAFGRVLLEDGSVDTFQTFIFAPDTAARVVKDLPMPRGFLMNLTVIVTGAAPVLGRVFTRASIIRGLTGATIVTGTLLQGYVTSSQAQSWPGSPLQQTDGIPGYVVQSFAISPGPGNPMSFTVPAGRHWSLLSAQCSLTTDATVINRRPQVVPVGSNQTFIVHHTQVLGASGTLSFFWANGLTGNVDTTSVPNTAALPSRVELDVGEQIFISAGNLQPGDEFLGGGNVAVLERLQVT